MRKRSLLAICIVLALMLTACGGSGSGSPSASQPQQPDASSAAVSEPSGQAEAPEETAYEITWSGAKTYTDSIGTTWVQAITEIENTGSADLYLGSGAYDLEDADGGLIKSSTMVSAYPDVIAPGEKGYFYEETTLDEPVDGELTLLPRPSVDKAKVENIRYALSDLELSSDDFGNLKARGRVENTSSEASTMTYIVMVLKNAEDQPIGLMFTILSEELAAGDKIGFEMSAFSLPDDVTEETIASYEAFAYPMQMQF